MLSILGAAIAELKQILESNEAVRNCLVADSIQLMDDRARVDEKLLGKVILGHLQENPGHSPSWIPPENSQLYLLQEIIIGKHAFGRNSVYALLLSDGRVEFIIHHIDLGVELRLFDLENDHISDVLSAVKVVKLGAEYFESRELLLCGIKIH